ncbi:MAG TPA: FAD-binding protein [Acidimicrobiia bacterium]|nr:FAD-binding protein [Acidimicrobiia bacterium]
MTTWDKSVDLVIVGSGGGGLVAAIAAIDEGLEPLVLEKQPIVGGSTGLSGGILWLPNNPLMRAEGVADSHEDGLAYLDAVVGDVGPASSPERREMFLRAGSEMVTFLQRKGLRLVRCPGYSDYYSGRPGGSAAGRSIEGVPFDAAELGAWQEKLAPSLAKGTGFVVKTNELRSIQYFNRSPATFAVATRVFFRTKLAQLRRQNLLTNGASLVGQLLEALMQLSGEPPVWTESPVEDLVVEDGRVVGVRVLRDGAPLDVEGRKGVLLAAGGFGHNAEMRRKYSGDQPNEAQWSIANAGDTGEVLESAMRLGAKTDLLDEAWWLPQTSRALGAAGASIGQARQRPGAIFVDSTGQRFCNESNSYVEVGKAMYANKAVPCWVVFDDGYARRYAPTANPLQRRLPEEVIDNGAIRKADTLEDLARQIGVDPDGLARTVGRFNEYARKGLDPDFGRGQSAYNDCLGDPGYKPNRAIGPLDRAPFYATEVYPGDVGTCGGLVTDQYARVLDESDRPIPGLYATGNITATVMGRTYPGAGASVANTMVFGYVAARHAGDGRLPDAPGVGDA